MKSHQKPHSAGRSLLAVAVVFAGLTTGAFAQSIAQINTALSDLYTSGTTVAAASAAQLEYAIDLIASPVGTTVVAPAPHQRGAGHAGLGLPQDAAADITDIFTPVTGLGQQSSATLAADLVAGFVKGGNGISQYLGSVTAAAAAVSNFSATADTSAKTVIGDAITAAPTDLDDILVKSLVTYDSNSSAQAAMIVAEATSAHITSSGQSEVALSGSIAAADSASISNVGAFLVGIVGTYATAALQEGFVQGYTAVSATTPSALAITATSIAAQAPTTLTAGHLVDAYVGLFSSGTFNGIAPSAFIPGIVTGLLSNGSVTATSTDALKTTLVGGATGLITTTESGGVNVNAPYIAAAGATTLATPSTSAYAYANEVLANTDVKAGTGSDGVIGVDVAIADAFPVTSAITGEAGNFDTWAAVAQSGVKATGTNGAALVTGSVANQVFTSGSGSSALVTFAANFIGAVDSKSTGFTAITAADQADAAIGLIEDYDSGVAHPLVSVPGLAAAVSASAAATNDSSALTINNVAQPILTYSLANLSGAETGSVAAAIAQIQGTYGPSATAYTPQYIAAQLILAAKTGSPLAPNAPLIQDIALGVSTNSAIDTSAGSANDFVTLLSGQLATTADLPYIKVVLPYLISSGSFTDVQIAADINNAGGAIGTANAAGITESGTLVGVLVSGSAHDAAAIAYAAANGTGIAAGSAGDGARYVIAEDAFRNGTAGAAATLAISGSVGTLVATADKPTFTEDLVKLDTTAADDANITLQVVNGLSSVTDLTFASDTTLITKDAIAGYTSGNKTATNVANLVSTVAFGYNGSLSGASGNFGGAVGVATYAGSVLADESAVTGLSNALATTLVPEAIVTLGSDTAANIPAIAGDFSTNLPKSALAIAGAATSSTLYNVSTNTQSPTENGEIGGAIAAALPSSTTGLPALSGSIALLSATAAYLTGGQTHNDALAGVAQAFATAAFSGTAIPVTSYPAIATTLGNNATLGLGTSSTPGGDINNSVIPSIASGFLNTSLGSGGTTTTGLEGFLTVLAQKYYVSAADLLGVALLEESTPTTPSAAATLEGYIDSAIDTAAYLTPLSTLVPDNTRGTTNPFAGDSTLTEQKAELLDLLNAAVAAYDANPAVFESVATDPEETPVVNM